MPFQDSDRDPHGPACLLRAGGHGVKVGTGGSSFQEQKFRQ
jgi:hypothetical protein